MPRHTGHHSGLLGGLKAPVLAAQGTAPFGKVLTLSGTTDKGGSSVLLSGYSGNRNVRLWGLPDFSDRGCLNAIEAIAVACSHDHIFAGDYTRGSIKMWRWKTA